ncbi:ABC transporter permease [Sphingobium sufflavum]|uniref:ABC transporter permease n=1 Tax=Sphingobium sufflavum TaxID=1129547 RepID=UPI001F205753|nr:ABC transporter permease [Sphingobium sufflavum]MCE7795658.1 ABC transporter permease [Sphingobium sufflavum]
MSRTRFSPRRLRALVVKEFIQVARDPSTFIIAFLLPPFLLFLMGYSVSLDTAQVRVALVNQDSSAQALGLATAFARSPYFSVTPARDVQSVRGALEGDRERGIIVIPQGFGEGVLSGHPPPIQVITDGSQPNTANFLGAYADGVRAEWLASETGRAAAPPISVNTRYWYNPGLESRYFLVPGSIAIVMTMIGTLLTALVIAREWERGTMEAMMATPISMVEFVGSKVLPYFLLGLASMAVCTILAIIFFHVPFRGSVAALLAISSAFLLPALGLGLFISAATKNQFVASQIALLSAFLPTFLLSGFLYEIASMPFAIRLITYAVPARYLIPPLQTVFLAGDIWGLILPNILIMLGFGVGFFYLAFRVTKRSLD